MIEIIPNWHPILVHYTVALLSVASLLFFLSFCLWKKPIALNLNQCATVNLYLGVLITFVTVTTGLYAYSTVHHDGVSHVAMKSHRNFAFATLIVFLVVAFYHYKFLFLRRISKFYIALLVVANIFLLTTAYKGGELVYRYGLGVLSLPSEEEYQHEH